MNRAARVQRVPDWWTRLAEDVTAMKVWAIAPVAPLCSATSTRSKAGSSRRSEPAPPGPRAVAPDGLTETGR
jgi:hypothetical protein